MAAFPKQPNFTSDCGQFDDDFVTVSRANWRGFTDLGRFCSSPPQSALTRTAPLGEAGRTMTKRILIAALPLLLPLAACEQKTET
ncbi:MAG: hypothetical protein ACRCSO_08330, partial [Sphingomonas sp.]